MSLDPELKAFMEQAGLLKKPGSTARRPEVILAESRESVGNVTLTLGAWQSRYTREDVPRSYSSFTYSIY